MSITRYIVGKLPQESQYGLDRFTENWKCFETADVVLVAADVPQRGSVHPDYPHLYVTDRSCTESGESSSSLSLVYQGAFKDDGEGNAVMPPQQHSDEG